MELLASKVLSSKEEDVIMPKELSLQMRLLRATLIAVGLVATVLIYLAIKIEAEHYYRMVKAGTIWCLIGDIDRCVDSATKRYQ